MCGTKGGLIHLHVMQTDIKAVVLCGILDTSSKGFLFLHIMQ
jgi:hypothetical protein